MISHEEQIRKLKARLRYMTKRYRASEGAHNINHYRVQISKTSIELEVVRNELDYILSLPAGKVLQFNKYRSRKIIDNYISLRIKKSNDLPDGAA